MIKDIDMLKTLYQIIQQGKTQVVLIQGEAGIGKIHPVSAFLDWAVDQGRSFCSVLCRLFNSPECLFVDKHTIACCKYRKYMQKKLELRNNRL